MNVQGHPPPKRNSSCETVQTNIQVSTLRAICLIYEMLTQALSGECKEQEILEVKFSSLKYPGLVTVSLIPCFILHEDKVWQTPNNKLL